MSTVRRSHLLGSLSTYALIATSLGLAGCGGSAHHASAPAGGYVVAEARPVSASPGAPPAPYVTTYEGTRARGATPSAGASDGAEESSGSYAKGAPPAPYVTGGAVAPKPASKAVADAPVSAPRAAAPTAAPAKGDAAKKESAAPIVTTAPKAPEAPIAPGTTITATGTVVIGGNPPPPPPPTPVVTQTVPQGGLLTAAIQDDNAQRPDFVSFLARYPGFKETWGLDIGRRVTIRVEDSAGVSVGDAPIALRAPDGSAFQLRAHADGTTYFYPPSSGVVIANQNGNQKQGTTWAIASQVGQLRTESTFVMPQVDGTVTVRLPGVPGRAAQPALDVAFVVDCTGSMGDEISYLQAELAGVVTAVKSQQGTRRLRLGLVLYRDRGDDYVTKTYDFTEDLPTFLAELKTASAQGGGDIPESVNAALNETVHRLSWAGDETGRLAILVADAPPHFYADEAYTYKHALPELNARGIKLVTVGASGVDKSTEYLFREASAYTGGRYVWLTDDSGVGEAHTYADTPSYQVEHLDRLLIRVIGDEARAFRR